MIDWKVDNENSETDIMHKDDDILLVDAVNLKNYYVTVIHEKEHDPISQSLTALCSPLLDDKEDILCQGLSNVL